MIWKSGGGGEIKDLQEIIMEDKTLQWTRTNLYQKKL